MEPQLSASDGAGSSAAPNTKLFIGGLSWNTDEDKLRAYFAQYGDVEDVVVMRDRTTRNPRGFGFVTFATEEAARAACKEAHSIDGRTIDAKPSVPQGEGGKPRSKKVFVGGLAPDTTEEQFREYFTKFGTVLEATIMLDHNSNRSRGFGFVTFEEEASVQEIFKAGPMHMLGGKQVEVKSATPKGSGPIASAARGVPAVRNGFTAAVPRPGATMGNGTAMVRGYEGAYGQQGFGMTPFAMPGQYPQYAYGMQPYGGFPGMMVGYGYAPGAYPGAYGQPPYGQAPQGQGQGVGQQQQQQQQQGGGGGQSQGQGQGQGQGQSQGQGQGAHNGSHQGGEHRLHGQQGVTDGGRRGGTSYSGGGGGGGGGGGQAAARKVSGANGHGAPGQQQQQVHEMRSGGQQQHGHGYSYGGMSAQQQQQHFYHGYPHSPSGQHNAPVMGMQSLSLGH